jgi:hypothetical protein
MEVQIFCSSPQAQFSNIFEVILFIFLFISSYGLLQVRYCYSAKQSNFLVIIFFGWT